MPTFVGRSGTPGDAVHAKRSYEGVVVGSDHGNGEFSRRAFDDGAERSAVDFDSSKGLPSWSKVRDNVQRSSHLDDLEPYKPRSISGDNFVEIAPPKGKIIAYARYSTMLQNISSIERQFEKIEGYAASRSMHIDYYFSDKGISGTSSERAGLDEVCAIATRYPGSIVLVENLDRLSRDIPEYGRIKGIFDKAGTKIHDSGGHNTPLVEIIKAGIAADGRLRLLELSAAGKIAAARRGELLPIRCAYGYRRSGPGRMEIDPETAPNVRLMFELRAKGLNYKQIIDELCKRGIKGPKTDRFSTSTLRNLLRNEIYVGWLVYELTKPAGHH